MNYAASMTKGYSLQHLVNKIPQPLWLYKTSYLFPKHLHQYLSSSPPLSPISSSQCTQTPNISGPSYDNYSIMNLPLKGFFQKHYALVF